MSEKSEKSLAEKSIAGKSMAEESMAEKKSLTEKPMAEESMAEKKSLTEKPMSEKSDKSEKSLAEKSIAGKSIAGKSMAGKSIAGMSMAGKSMAEESMAEKSMAEKKSLTEKPMSEKSEKSEKSLAGKSMAGKSIAGKSIAGMSIAGMSMAEESMAEKSMAEESMAEKKSSTEKPMSEKSEKSSADKSTKSLAKKSEMPLTEKPKSRYRPIKDITVSDALPLHEVDPDLAVLRVEPRKSIATLLTLKASRSAALQSAKKALINLDLGLDLLKKTGWDKGVRMPFANKENQALEKILEERQMKHLMIHTELQDNLEHLRMLQESFTRANEDIGTQQNFLISKRKIIEEEKNLMCLAERSLSRFVQDKQITEKEMKNCNERCNRMQCRQERRLKNLCELRDLIEFDREVLKEYQDRLTAYQNEKLELGKIIDEDSKTAEELNKQSVELASRRKVLRMELDQKAMTTQKCQEQFDRLSQEFRKVNRHRQEMIMVWSSNIDNVQKKDAEMLEISQEYFKIKTKIRELASEMEFRERQYKQLQCEIHASHLKLDDMDKKMSGARKTLLESKEIITQLNDSLIELLSGIRASSMEQKHIQAKFSAMESELSGLDEKIEKMRNVVTRLQNKLREISKERYCSDQNINLLEKMHEDELRKMDSIHREMEVTRKLHWQRSNEMKEVTAEMLRAETQIKVIKGNSANLEGKELANLEFLAKQSAKVYRLDLDSSKLENKLTKVEGETKDAHFFSLQGELWQYQEARKQLLAEKKYIEKEVVFLQQLISKNGKELARRRDEKQKLSTVIVEISMVSQRTQKLIGLNDKTFQDMQVENSLEMVNLKRITDAMKLAKEQLYGLAEERETIQWAVNERKAEIENNKTLNMNKTKALLESVNKLKVHIHEMDRRTDKLRGRFDQVTKLMISTKESEQADAIAERVRRAARERESLQLEMRKWEARVKDAQKELAGLENVHKLIVASNMSVKDRLGPIEEESTESQDLQVLEEEEKAIHVRKNRALNFRDVLLDKMEDLKQQLAVREQESQATTQRYKNKLVMLAKTESEHRKQKETMKRWTTKCNKLLREIKSKGQFSDFDILEKDIKLRFVQEKLDCAFTMLERFLMAFPSYKMEIIDYFENNAHLVDLAFRLVRKSTMQMSMKRKSSASSRKSLGVVSRSNSLDDDESIHESRSSRMSADQLDSSDPSALSRLSTYLKISDDSDTPTNLPPEMTIDEPLDYIPNNANL